MIPQLYQTHLKNQLPKAQYLLLTLLVQLLQVIKQVKLETLASTLPIPILFESRRKKIQRFLSLPQLTIEGLWFPLVQAWLTREFEAGEMVYLVIDRTQWMNVNLLVLSVVWGKRAYPIYWQLLNKQGCSSFAEQIVAFKKVLFLLETYRVVVLGDREFCSVRLGRWLKRKRVYFCLRLRKNEYVEVERELHLQFYELCLEPGMSLYFEGVRVTLKKGFGRFNVACKYQDEELGWAPEEPWFILTNLESLTAAMAAYKKRFDIEEMFRDFKQGGYNLEATNVDGERLISLILLIAIAYTAATLNGQKIKRLGIEKYVGRVKEAERTEPRHSHFYIGLYGQTWVQFMAPYAEIVAQLLHLSPHKRHCYRKGLRAMSLIQSAL
ncbi:IS4 family transposase [bacterium]|nr:IS4 family transposase [bacterium]